MGKSLQGLKKSTVSDKKYLTLNMCELFQLWQWGKQ